MEPKIPERSGIRDYKHIIFAINECEEGWDYYILDSEYQSIQDGVYDDPDMTVGEVILVPFEEDEVIARYEEQLRQNKYTCCIRSKECCGYGNNPDPVKTDSGARRCDICNYNRSLFRNQTNTTVLN